jgi:hypothetical protein
MTQHSRAGRRPEIGLVASYLRELRREGRTAARTHPRPQAPRSVARATKSGPRPTREMRLN